MAGLRIIQNESRSHMMDLSQKQQRSSKQQLNKLLGGG